MQSAKPQPEVSPPPTAMTRPAPSSPVSSGPVATDQVGAPAMADVPVPPAPTASAPATPSTPIQEAARPPASSAPAERYGVGDQVRVAFAKGESDLPEDMRGALTALVAALNADTKLRVELQAFADGTAETASQARRLSLSRALTIRSYLIEQGLLSTRMDVRALGSRFEGGPPDRVDVVVTER